jgi:hypothetical protein
MSVLSMSLKGGFQQGGDSTPGKSGFAGNFTGDFTLPTHR